ncbi:unnamed protein product [Adineta steineri]|uniref:Single cache domain-containing protein n=1 Tax=Adineta steineri TaxID=433720 RepID=A0A814DAY8_9BILA|nr:unnamed protein product [Adineta steineri]CAF1510678.1 unnamed protein product [Adineta steineri]
MMHWFYVFSMIIIICLQNSSNANVTEDPVYVNINKQIEQFIPLVNQVNEYLANRPGDAVMSYGIKSASDSKYIRTFTNVKLANGEVAHGSFLTNPNVINALDNKQVFKGIVDLYGRMYQAVYKPVINKRKIVIGYWFVGVPV